MSQDNPFLKVEEPKEKNIFIDILQSIAIAITLSVFLYMLVITPNEVDGPSMLPNFETNDLLFTSRLHNFFNGTGVGDSLDLEYDRGDVVVFQKPDFVAFVKRVIGLPGETISIEDGNYYIDGKRLREFYDLNNNLRIDGDFLAAQPNQSYTLKEDEYFLSGDNRNVSFDSRNIDIGPIKEEWIKGKVVFRFWPIQKFGVISAGKYEIED